MRTKVTDYSLKKNINDLNKGSFTDYGDDTPAKQTADKNTEFNNTISQLAFWTFKGLTLSQVEDTYNFDFVVDDNCVPIIYNGHFIIDPR